jgi:hypothetical protein
VHATTRYKPAPICSAFVSEVDILRLTNTSKTIDGDVNLLGLGDHLQASGSLFGHSEESQKPTTRRGCRLSS